MRHLLIACLFLAAAWSGHCAESGATDLGEGLSYLRIVRVEGDASTGIAGPLVLDLRRASAADTAAAGALIAPLRTPGPLRLVLVSAQTAPTLLGLLETRAASVLLLGAASSVAGLDLALSVTGEEDLRAFDAHTQGADLTGLIQPLVRKTRRDEAAIVRRRANTQSGDSRKTADPEEDGGAPDAANGEPAEPTLVDTVLQRAVHLHRGLKALGRL